MTEAADFLTEYEALAAEIAKAARMDATALGDKIDAIKALTPFYIQKMKHEKSGIDEDDMPTFGDFSNQIHATEHTNGRS